MKIIFVGMHNKPGKLPLDPSTVSGKLIDRIIKLLPKEISCLKINLFNTDYMPEKSDFDVQVRFWFSYGICKSDCFIVLLGKFVQKNFPVKNCNIIKLRHPSFIFGSIKQSEYVHESFKKILTIVNQTLNTNS